MVMTAASEGDHRVQHYARFWQAEDPLADAVAAAFAERAAGGGRAMLETALDRGIGAVDDPPPALVALFRQLDEVPYWVDWDRIDRGSAAFLRTGLLGMAVLNLFCLPIMYYSPCGNKPLVFTGNLLKRAPRRLAETGRFVLECSRPDGLRRFSDGFKTNVKVRLMHAQVRRLLRRSGRWNPKWGAPVNQLYMAGTNVALSAGLIEGLERLGYRMGAADVEALLHLWRYTGYISGIAPELQISTREEGRHLGELIHQLEGQPDDDSRALITALMSSSYHPRLEGATWTQKINYGVSRKLIGNELADDLGYPRSHWGWTVSLARPMAGSLGLIHRYVPLLRSAAPRWGDRTWDFMLDLIMGGSKADYHAPAHLARPAPEEKAA
ncbi:MAG TPA: oxygenase MpaB family protein [Acetobacteraceae bacterium]|nr:oxygenase MpaB family protein [Acetobacteraceae bacterium]